MGSDRYAFHADLLAESEMPRRGIHSQTISDQHDIELVLFAMASGEQLSEHTSARPAIVHVLSGEGHLTVDGDRHDVKPGSWMRMEARTPHALVAATALVFALYLLPQGFRDGEPVERS